MKSLTAAVPMLLLLAVIALGVWGIAEHATSLDRFEYGEGPLAAFVLRWTEEPPTHAWSDLPFTGIAYGPLMLAVWRAAATWWPDTHLVLVGRLVALTATSLLVIFVAVVVYRNDHSALPSLVAVGLLIASPAAAWFPWARVDTMACALTAAAYLVLGREGTRLTAAAAFLALASLAKQSAAAHAIPLAFMAWTLWGRSIALRYVLATTALGLAIWSLTFAVYDGYFFEASTQATWSRLSPWMYFEKAQPWLSAPITIWMLCAGFAYAMTHGLQALRSRWWIGFVFAAGFDVLTSLKEGSDVNYFIDATWLGAIVAGYVCGDLLRRWRGAVQTAIALAALLSLPPLVLTRLEAKDATSPDARRRHLLEWAHKGPVLVDGEVVGFLPRDVRPLVNDPFLFRLRDDAGRAPTERLAKALADPSVTIVFWVPVEAHLEAETLGRIWPDTILKQIEAEFSLVDRSAGLFIYRRRTDSR